MSKSYNPKFRALVERVQPKIDAFERENPFLGGFLREHFNNRGTSKRMGYNGAEALIALLKDTGVAGLLRSPEDVDRRPDVFWKLADAAKATGNNYAINGLLCLYYHFRRAGFFKSNFKKAEKSPARFLSISRFWSLMKGKYTCSDDLFFIGYSKNRHKAPMIIHWTNRDLLAMVVDAFTRWPNTYDRSSKTLALLYESEDWFEDKGKTIHSYKDFTEDVLTTCIGHIMSIPKGQWRTVSMQFLFWLFSVQITDHPEHRFFERSHLWTPGIVIDRRIPVHLAAGYRFAIYGQTDEVTQDRGILLILKDGDLMSANGLKNEVYTIDLSGITVPLYWKALANYAVRTTVNRVSGAKSFVSWLINYKKLTGAPYGTVSAEELERFRAFVSHLSVNGSARNQRINEARKFLTWASAAGYLVVQEFAMRDFIYFEYHYVPRPNPLDRDTIRRLIVATEWLALNFDPRFALLSRIIRIIYTCEIRIGNLVSMCISNLRFNEDGTATYMSRIKSKGVDKHPVTYTKATAVLFRECIDLTEDVRRDCPAGIHDGCIFIYRNGPESRMPFGVYTPTRVSQDLKIASRKAGLDANVTTGQLRDTYMTATERYARKNGLNDLQQSILTRHANRLSTRSYVRYDIGDMLMEVDEKKARIGKL